MKTGESKVPSALRWDANPGPRVSICNAALRGLFFMFSLCSVNIQPTSNQPVQSCSLTLCRTSEMHLQIFDYVGKHMFLFGRFHVYPVEPDWKRVIIPPRWHTLSTFFVVFFLKRNGVFRLAAVYFCGRRNGAPTAVRGPDVNPCQRRVGVSGSPPIFFKPQSF